MWRQFDIQKRKTGGGEESEKKRRGERSITRERDTSTEFCRWLIDTACTHFASYLFWPFFLHFFIKKKVSPPKNALFFIITSPVGPYFKAGFAPVKILAEDSYRRAWPGGTGNFKVPLELRRQTEAERGRQSTERASEREGEGRGERERDGGREGEREREGIKMYVALSHV